MRVGFKPDEKEETSRSAIGGSARAFWCAACMTRVADEDAAIDVGGAPRHRFSNPSGVEFEIGCFSDARCRVEGEPTLEATWFAGLAWSYASCANCATHLGWFWRGDGARFYGLILARLVGPV